VWDPHGPSKSIMSERRLNNIPILEVIRPEDVVAEETRMFASLAKYFSFVFLSCEGAITGWDASGFTSRKIPERFQVISIVPCCVVLLI
jgi:hypothetical protein